MNCSVSDGVNTFGLEGGTEKGGAEKSGTEKSGAEKGGADNAERDKRVAISSGAPTGRLQHTRGKVLST